MKRTLVSPETRISDKKSNFAEVGPEPTAPLPLEPQDPPKHAAKVRKAMESLELRTLAEKVAGNKTGCQSNYKIPQAEKHFPVDINSRFVDKYYPYAVGGPLYVDEPTTEYKMIKAYEKQKILRKMGLRSLVIESYGKNDMALKDLNSSLADCYEQLEGK